MLRFALLVLSALMLSLQAFADIRAVRIAGDADVTRVIIEMDGSQTHREFLSTNDGHSLVLDLPGAVWGADTTEAAGRGGVVSYAWNDGRLTLSLSGAMMPARILDLPPSGNEAMHRIVLDLSRVSEARFARSARNDMTQLARLEAAPMQPIQVAAHTPYTGMQRYVIVIDAGHGGNDPGTSHHGAIEKRIVLKAATTLRDILAENPRYDVRLTRSDDTFVEHADRVGFAREWGANLFISIHADAAANSDVEGASVYTLNSKGVRRSDSVAAEENWELPIETGASDAVSGILADLLKRETQTNSGKFASLLIPELARAGPVLRNTHRSENFFVLLAPDVPAVLLEMGFLTNSRDARRLSSNRGRKRAMASVARAIDTYFAQQDVLFASE